MTSSPRPVQCTAVEWYRTFGKVFLESVPVADRAARASATTVEAFFSASMSSLTPAEELMVESVAKLRGAGSSAAASKFVVSQ